MKKIFPLNFIRSLVLQLQITVKYKRSAGLRRRGFNLSKILFRDDLFNLAINPALRLYLVLVAQPKILKINFVNIITKFYITI